MANPNIRGLIGFNPSSGTTRLLAAYENDVVNLATGLGYGLNLNTSNDVEFEIFLDRIFFQNYNDRPLTYKTSTNKWTTEHVARTPLSKYIKAFKNRLFLGYCKFGIPQIPSDTDGNSLVFPSRVFYSDLFTGPELTWGLEWGKDATINGLTNIFRLTTDNGDFLVQDFIVRNIKVGDPLIITQTDTVSAKSELVKTHLVTSVDSAYRLILDSVFSGNANGSFNDFWVGSNWFDVSPDDGDVITGFGENSNRLLIFKLLSLWFYTGSQLVQVKGAPGTSYSRSVINDTYGNTYYFHGSDPKISGIYKYNGASAVKISRAIDPFIAGMAASNYGAVVAWAEGNELRFFLGNLSATNLIEAMTNAVATYNVDTGAWSVDPIADNITATSTWIVSSQQNSFLGTNDAQVLKMDSGNSQNGTAIRARLETKVYYPASSEIVNTFPYLQVVARNAKGVKVKYKLWDIPNNERYSLVDQDYSGAGEIEGDLTEFILPDTHFTGSGIQIMFEELGTTENDWYIEKVSIFYKPDRSRLA